MFKSTLGFSWGGGFYQNLVHENVFITWVTRGLRSFSPNTEHLNLVYLRSVPNRTVSDPQSSRAAVGVEGGEGLVGQQGSCWKHDFSLIRSASNSQGGY